VLTGLLYTTELAGVPAQILVGREGFTARSKTGTIELPYRGSTLVVGGDANAYLIVSHPQAEGNPEIYLDRRVDLLGALEREGAPASFLDRVKERESAESRRSTASLAKWSGVLALLVLLCGVCLLNVRALAIRATPTKWEVAFNQSMEPSLNLQYSKNAELEAFVQQICERILASRPNQPYPFRYVVTTDATVNACAVSGGLVIVNAGLIARAESPEEVAGVLGHEIAHVLLRHSLKSAIDQLGTMAVVGTLTGNSAALEAIQHTLLFSAFSRGHESEADEVGVRLLHHARIDPRAMATFFDSLAELEKARGGGGDGAMTYLSSHPATSERSANVREMADALPATAYDPVDCDWERIRDLAASVAR
jgi:predicted Zn-dependent protease